MGDGELIDAAVGAALFFTVVGVVAAATAPLLPSCGSVIGSALGQAAALLLGILYSWRRGLLGRLYHRPRLKPRSIAGLIALAVAVMLVSGMILKPGTQRTERLIEMCLLQNPAIMIPVALIVAPATEELFFRGLIQMRLQERIGRLPALLAASLLFYAAHIPALGPVKAIGVFVEALVLGTPILLGDSLWTCMMLHASVNLVGIILSM